MASNPENVRLTILMKLQEALDEEVILEEQMLALMHRFADRFTDRRVKINNLMVLHDHPLIDYVAFRAQFCKSDHGSNPFILLKALASQDLWIWRAFFCVSGVNNDMNVLRQNHIFNDHKSEKALEVTFVATEVTYKRGCYLTDEIYLEWFVLIKFISNPGSIDHKRIMYEAARKDVKRAFGVSKRKWKVIKQLARGMTLSKIKDIMYTCVVLHYMIIKDNEHAISPEFYPDEQHSDDDPVRTHDETVQVISELHTTQLSLKGDLVKHI
nr:protein ALP1-like isoform X1 [Tanacetum cinerariifolium]